MRALDSKDLFYKHQKILQIFEYFDELRIRNIIREKYPDCQESILKNLVDIKDKINYYIETKASKNGEEEKVINQKERVINEIKPMLANIFEDENSQECSSLVEQP